MSPPPERPPFWKLLIPFVAAQHHLALMKTEPKVGHGLVAGLTGVSELAYPVFCFWLANEYNFWPAAVGVYAAGRLVLAAIPLIK